MKRDPFRLALTIMRRSPGDFFCVSTKSPSGKWKDNFFKRTELSKIPGFVKGKMSSDVYMCPQGFSEARRHKDFAEDPFTLFADLDECNPRRLAIKPTVAIESSPGRYVAFWFTDSPVSEELNRRMSYHSGADVSGWDYTQVLRFPGTKNHKYKRKPTVKVLWSDGPRYSVKRLEKMVPQIEDKKGKTYGGKAQDIYEDYEDDLSRRVRKELINPRIDRTADRSKVLWWLIQECVETGMKEEEIFTLLWENEWNKFNGRRGGEAMLQRQISKALGSHVGGNKELKRKTTKKKTKKGKSKFFEVITMDKVVEEKHDWLVEDFIARGEPAMVEGDPGVGKSYFLMWLAIHFCDGKPLPWEKDQSPREPLRVAYCDTENSMGTVTKGRLMDNGLKNQQNYIQLQEFFSIKDEEHLDALEQEIIIGQKIDVLFIDPINPYLGDADNYNAKEVQQSLQDLKSICRLHGVALVLVRHLNKSKAVKALYAGGGSIGFAGLARVVATVGWHPDEPNTRVVACTKNNLSKPFGSLGYAIEPLPDTMKRTNRSELIYEGRVDFTSDDILGTTNQKEDNSVDIAADLIRECMKEEGEEINYHALLKQADGRSISERSVKKAAANLDLKKVSRGRGNARKTYLVPK